MIQKQKRSLRKTIVGGLAALAAIIAPGCYNGASVSPVVGFGARAIPSSMSTMGYDSATSVGRKPLSVNSV